MACIIAYKKVACLTISDVKEKPVLHEVDQSRPPRSTRIWEPVEGICSLKLYLPTHGRDYSITHGGIGRQLFILCTPFSDGKNTSSG